MAIPKFYNGTIMMPGGMFPIGHIPTSRLMNLLFKFGIKSNGFFTAAFSKYYPNKDGPNGT